MHRTQIPTPLKAIETCWEETFPDLEFLPDIPWCETGADSLKSVLFMLHLEQLLGISIPLDNLTRDTTPRELASAIADISSPSSENAPIFLLPGMLGDEPRLVAFRQSFTDRIRFHLLNLPDIERSSRVLSSIPLSAAILREEIEKLQPQGPIRLAGYSVGGVIAFEIATQLEAAGREVTFLCLLDPFLRIRLHKPLIDEAGQQSPILFARDSLTVPKGAKALGEKLAFTLPLLFGRLESARRHLVKVARTIPLGTLYWRRQRLIGRLRWIALRRWRASPLGIPALLISSDEAETHFDVEEWDRLLPALQRIHVGGTHLGLFEPQPLSVITPAVTEALLPKS
ncbi:thioesterase domain-containing protein [Altererythrobacter atlanticus]|uniref:Dimodular nonribosomal peptide synthase n=1 Tax=Croceibacterium atlanticum TaxID=1267766 RepID=A0A0F7KKZ8_9SPHN|nr:thioesterase domain-containing protein [Croceibacterium atlanticum]AKH41238.1 Dimodular nonribosomal peptide synthase [Croceibacterium atlanticum]MBB5732756.1 thioesterase domain-containing protein [Croceibacterium atlanticum]